MEHLVILAGDIGGTKTNLALFSSTADSIEVIAEETYPSHTYNCLDNIVANFFYHCSALL